MATEKQLDIILESELEFQSNNSPMANEPTIDVMNEAIALFDGYERYEDKFGIWFKREGLIKCLHPKLQELKYHTSWDSLKPVIDEISKYALAYPEQVKPIIAMSVVVDIKAAHERVYQFCKWINQQKQKDVEGKK